MKFIRRFLTLFIILLVFVSHSQETSQEWMGYFSYNDIVDLTQGNGKLYAASENAVFIYDPLTNEIQTVTTIEGLSGDTISTVFYSEVYQLLVIGYENGLLQIYNEDENTVLSIIDIVNKVTIPPDAKRINQISAFNEFIYIASNFGVSVYNLERLEFDDTFFIGFNGTQIQVKETAIFDGFIYAACQDGNGLKKALLTSENLINFEEWVVIAPGNFLTVDATNTRLYTLRNDNAFLRVINDVLANVGAFNPTPEDIRSVENELLITQGSQLNVYNEDFQFQFQVIRNDYEDINSDTVFNVTTKIDNTLYIGTNNLGVLAFNENNLDMFTVIRPNGPERNSVFSIEADSKGVWVTYGIYSISYNPGAGDSFGVSHLEDDIWVNISGDSVFGAQDLNKIAVNPFNPNQVLISSFRDGVLEIVNDEPVTLFDQTNSGLESHVNPNNPNDISIRVAGATFDNQGIYWCLTGRSERPLKSYDPSTNSWMGFSFAEILPNPFTTEFGYDDIDVDNAGNKWLGGFKLGIVGFSADGELRSLNSEDSNMPSASVYGLAVDRRNQVWIGTNRGLRVLTNTSSFFNDPNPQVSSIIILEDGLAQELLFQQFITDIEVDGSNNKWIATADVGVFYVSQDGQETIHHFTKDNSPLPSNNVVDISINEVNGRVYLGTNKGLVSFDSGSSAPLESLENAFVFPNPVRPNYDFVEKKIKIKDISENVNIKITDISGNLVAEAESNTNLRNRGFNLEIDGGTAFWNGKNLSGTKVASGVYLVMLTDLDNLETKVLKLMLVR